MAGMNLRSNARFPTRRLPAECSLPRTDEIGVDAALLQKFLMRAALHNPSLRDDDNLPRVPHGVESMRDHDDRLASLQLGDGLVNQPFGRGPAVFQGVGAAQQFQHLAEGAAVAVLDNLAQPLAFRRRQLLLGPNRRQCPGGK